MVQVADAPRLQPRLVRQSLRRPRTLAAPRLSIVIVNYCQWENTTALVRELRRSDAMRGGAVEIVIVDNHSPRHKLARQLRRWPGVSLRRWGRNRGFARAVNEGARLSRGDWLLLLNPDMSLSPGFLDGVLALATDLGAQDARAGVVGFRLRNSDGSPQLSSGPFPSLPGTLAGLAKARPRRKYRALSPARRARVPWVTGCCLLVRRDCWRDLGGFDEDFFLYYEDVDLCRRARARGWSIWYEPSLHAVHHNPIHGRAVPPALRLVTRHSLLTYGKRHWPGWQVRLLAMIVLLESWARRLWAWWRRDTAAADVECELTALVGDLWRNDPRGARRRLRRVVNDHARALVSPVRTPEARSWSVPV